MIYVEIFAHLTLSGYLLQINGIESVHIWSLNLHRIQDMQTRPSCKHGFPALVAIANKLRLMSDCSRICHCVPQCIRICHCSYIAQIFAICQRYPVAAGHRFPSNVIASPHIFTAGGMCTQNGRLSVNFLFSVALRTVYLSLPFRFCTPTV